MPHTNVKIQKLMALCKFSWTKYQSLQNYTCKTQTIPNSQEIVTEQGQTQGEGSTERPNSDKSSPQCCDKTGSTDLRNYSNLEVAFKTELYSKEHWLHWLQCQMVPSALLITSETESSYS